MDYQEKKCGKILHSFHLLDEMKIGFQELKILKPYLFLGARGENRTRTAIRPRDFKSFVVIFYILYHLNLTQNIHKSKSKKCEYVVKRFIFLSHSFHILFVRIIKISLQGIM